MQALSPASSLLQPPVSLLEKTPAILETLLRDVPTDVLDWKPAPDRWSITEVLAHLLMIEQLYGDRAKRIVVDNNPTLAKYVEPNETHLRKKNYEPVSERVCGAAPGELFSSGMASLLPPPRAPGFMRRWEPSPFCNCLTNLLIMILATCGRSPNCTAQRRSIRRPAHFRGTQIPSHERTS